MHPKLTKEWLCNRMKGELRAPWYKVDLVTELFWVCLN
ncbi:hypothetical protein ES705_09404 [subsurface metagenome]